MFTTLTKEALPLIRYRTGDLGAITDEPCRCGRTTARLIRLSGRRDDMVIVRGVNVYPSQVEHLLLERRRGGAALAADRRAAEPDGRAHARVRAQHADLDRDALAHGLEGHLRDGLGVRIVVSVLEPGAVPRSEGKAVRVVDRR